jgi:hypothetical protein
MKRLHPLCVVVLGLLGLLTPGEAHAQFLFVTNNGSITITGYTGPSGNVVIPTETNGLPVTSIGDFAFSSGSGLPVSGSPRPGPVPRLRVDSIPSSQVLLPRAVIPHAVIPRGITSVTIPGSVTNIGQLAFFSCTNLTRATMSNGLVSIGDGAFYGCTRLPQVTIPASVATIGNSAFYFCTNLAGIKIPNGVASIGDFAFFGCASLVSAGVGSGVTNIGPAAFSRCPKLPAITVAPANSNYASLNGVLFDKNLDTLEAYPGGKTGIYIIPNRVAVIATDAFNFCTKLTSVTIPNTVASIEPNAFNYCDKLTSAVIPNSVTNLGLAAFVGCTNLTSVTIGSGVTNIVVGSYGGTFSVCPRLLSFTVSPQNACYRGTNGVLFNKSMTTLLECPAGRSGIYVIPNGVTSIADGAFEACAKLSNVTIPNTVASIGSGSFLGCIGLTHVAIPNGVASIGSSAFSDCTSLKSLTIGSGVTNIAVANYGYGPIEGVFTDCPKLVSITVDTLNAYYSSAGGVLFDKNKTTLLQYPFGLTGSYAIPGSVNNVATAAFQDCTFLSGVTIPDGVTNLADWAFYGCTRLKSVSIPNSVISIGDNAFGDCTSLTNIIMPNGITDIGLQAFEKCSSLASVIIPASVTNLDFQAFGSCTSLAKIFFEGNAPGINPGVFLNGSPFTGDSGTVYYVQGTSGWTNTFGGLPTALWTPMISSHGFVVRAQKKQFGFMVSGAKNVSVVVEACTNLANPVWLPVQTNTLVNGTNYFSEALWTNCPGRFYRVRPE